MNTFFTGRVKAVALGVLVAFLLPAPVFGGAITVPLGSSGWEATYFEETGVTIVVDGVDPNSVTIQIFKDFVNGPGPGDVFPPINILFSQVADDANTVDRIILTDEAITNLTGVDWTDYHWKVLQAGEVWFNVAESDGFDVFPFQNIDFMDPQNIFNDPNKATDVWVDGGLVPDNTSFFPGLAEGALVMDVFLAGSDDPVNFTLKQFPTIPEPSTLAMVGAAVGLVLFRRRRRF